MDLSCTSCHINCCIFCMIARGEDQDAQVLKRDEKMVCFRDIFPAAPHHYLVVPVEHIVNCFSLHEGHITLVEKMVEMGRDVLRDQGVADMTDIAIGFHQPPYISVEHLHLHVLAPASEIQENMIFKFIPGTPSFVDEKKLRERLKSIPSWTSAHCKPS
nr:adenosine 5'-monophosphoramidase HINT3-like [Nerophis lumbriciformis]